MPAFRRQHTKATALPMSEASALPNLSNKRKRNGSSVASIEEIDLRDVDSDQDLARVLEQQRAATIRDQQAQAEKPTKLANVTCVVCMEELTNMTATHCGKLPFQQDRIRGSL